MPPGTRRKPKKKDGIIKRGLKAAARYFLDTSKNHTEMHKRPKLKGSFLKGDFNARNIPKTLRAQDK